MLGEKVQLVRPTEPVLYSFIPKTSFVGHYFNTEYLEGMKYHVREGNEVLDTAVKEWAEINLVEIIEDDDSNNSST